MTRVPTTLLSQELRCIRQDQSIQQYFRLEPQPSCCNELRSIHIVITVRQGLLKDCDFPVEILPHRDHPFRPAKAVLKRKVDHPYFRARGSGMEFQCHPRIHEQVWGASMGILVRIMQLVVSAICAPSRRPLQCISLSSQYLFNNPLDLQYTTNRRSERHEQEFLTSLTLVGAETDEYHDACQRMVRGTRQLNPPMPWSRHKLPVLRRQQHKSAQRAAAAAD